MGPHRNNRRTLWVGYDPLTIRLVVRVVLLGFAQCSHAVTEIPMDDLGPVRWYEPKLQTLSWQTPQTLV